MVTTDFGGGDNAWGLAFRPGGGIVAAGNTNGGPADFNGGEDEALSVAIEPSGKIVLAGLAEPIRAPMNGTSGLPATTSTGASIRASA